MHFFQHHIGDYRKDTAHLTLLEHGAYRQLIDLYYLNEKPLSSDDAKVMRLACARTPDEKEAVQNVLSDFFEKTAEGYTHKRCDSELNRIYEKSEKARESARARWSDKASAKQSDSERNANASKAHRKNVKKACDSHATHNPLTHNPLKEEPIAQNADAFAEFWSCYPRKKSKAGARKVWDRKKLGGALFDKVIAGLESAKQSEDWKKDDGKFIPYPAKWLNGECWEDELEISSEASVNYLEGIKNA